LSGLYNLQSTRSRLKDFGKIVVAVASGTMILVLVDYFSDVAIFPSKSIIIYGLMFSIMLVIFGRLVMQIIQQFLFRFNIGKHNLLIIGSKSNIAHLKRNIRFSDLGYKVLAGSGKYQGVSWLKKISKSSHIDEIIHLDFKTEKEQLDVMNFAINLHIIYKFVPGVSSLYHSNVVMGKLGDTPIVELSHTPLEGWGRIVKRIVDLVASALALILLSPFFLIVAIIIKLTDKGPVFYRHTRLSREGKKIKIYKFRTMLVQYCTGEAYDGKTDQQILTEIAGKSVAEEFRKNQKLKRDPRVSKIGHFLRRTSIDELPQLINVLVGEISLVGPRPITEGEAENYGDKISWFLAIKPGMTGLWQVSGRNEISYDERVKLDVYYVENWSLWFDIKIIYKTLAKVIKGGDGY
jgi:exopolysaccharide biosynthesis polyprenyl glycosylphosphotransferase